MALLPHCVPHLFITMHQASPIFEYFHTITPVGPDPESLPQALSAGGPGQFSADPGCHNAGKSCARMAEATHLILWSVNRRI